MPAVAVPLRVEKSTVTSLANPPVRTTVIVARAAPSLTEYVGALNCSIPPASLSATVSTAVRCGPSSPSVVAPSRSSTVLTPSTTVSSRRGTVNVRLRVPGVNVSTPAVAV